MMKDERKVKSGATPMSFTHLAVRPPSDSALLTKVAHGACPRMGRNPQDRTFALFSTA